MSVELSRKLRVKRFSRGRLVTPRFAARALASLSYLPVIGPLRKYPVRIRDGLDFQQLRVCTPLCTIMRLQTVIW